MKAFYNDIDGLLMQCLQKLKREVLEWLDRGYATHSLRTANTAVQS